MQIVGFVIVAAFAAIAVFIWTFGKHPISDSSGDWGTFGDYFGGVMNPVVGMATVVLIVISIVIQRRELRASLKEMKSANQAAMRMSFEQSLFAWLGNYHGLVASISHKGKSGREAVASLFSENLSAAAVLRAQAKSFASDSSFVFETAAEILLIEAINIPESGRVREELDALVLAGRKKYDATYRSHRSGLDAVFRTIYRLLDWIDRSELERPEKWHYIALIRAQLSWSEQALLLHNSRSEHGKRFAALANKYAMFDNLDAADDVLLFEIIMGARLERTQVAEPLIASAFSSKLARAALGLPSE